MVREFKEFITRGNLITLAVGFVMGIAFQAVVSSFVEHLVMPIVAIPFGQPDLSALTLVINGSVIAWGSFVTAMVVFVLTALAVFVFIVKPYNSYEARRSAQIPAEDPGPTEIELLTEIRDSFRRGYRAVGRFSGRGDEVAGLFEHQSSLAEACPESLSEDFSDVIAAVGVFEQDRLNRGLCCPKR